MFDKKKFVFSSLAITLLLFCSINTIEVVTHRRFLQEEENLGESQSSDVSETTQESSDHPADVKRIYSPAELDFWFCILMAAMLITSAAICSGMTVGYLSIDELQLEIYKEQGTLEQQRQANIIIPIIKQHHMLLCTLLIGNAFCMEALPIFFDKVVPPAFAVLISVIFIIFAGEIIPQALCTGPKQLIIAEKLTPLVKIFMVVFWPISYPLAKALDNYFGEHGATRFEKNELKALIELHGKQKQASNNSNEEAQGFSQAEINMITSTIDLREKKVDEVMIPIKEVFSVNRDNELNKETLSRIASSGYSYVTIYNGNKENIVGTARAKQLIDMELSKKKISELNNLVRDGVYIQSDISLFEMLMVFKQKKTKIAFVVEANNKNEQNSQGRSPSQISDKGPHKVVGLISLKQIFEEIVKKEFNDQDNHIKFNSIKQQQFQTIKPYVNRTLVEPEEKK